MKAFKRDTPAKILLYEFIHARYPPAKTRARLKQHRLTNTRLTRRSRFSNAILKDLTHSELKYILKNFVRGTSQKTR